MDRVQGCNLFDDMYIILFYTPPVSCSYQFLAQNYAKDATLKTQNGDVQDDIPFLSCSLASDFQPPAVNF